MKKNATPPMTIQAVQAQLIEANKRLSAIHEASVLGEVTRRLPTSHLGNLDKVSINQHSPTIQLEYRSWASGHGLLRYYVESLGMMLDVDQLAHATQIHDAEKKLATARKAYTAEVKNVIAEISKNANRESFPEEAVTSGFNSRGEVCIAQSADLIAWRIGSPSLAGWKTLDATSRLLNKRFDRLIKLLNEQSHVPLTWQDARGRTHHATLPTNMPKEVCRFLYLNKLIGLRGGIKMGLINPLYNSRHMIETILNHKIDSNESMTADTVFTFADQHIIQTAINYNMKDLQEALIAAYVQNPYLHKAEATLLDDKVWDQLTHDEEEENHDLPPSNIDPATCPFMHGNTPEGPNHGHAH